MRDNAPRRALLDYGPFCQKTGAEAEYESAGAMASRIFPRHIKAFGELVELEIGGVYGIENRRIGGIEKLLNWRNGCAKQRG
ncbi:MAG: hypothetical protein LBJ10_12205 [Clostridiales bacterium]|nr:hypothetical protein [Clostridiales bacterium]